MEFNTNGGGGVCLYGQQRSISNHKTNRRSAKLLVWWSSISKYGRWRRHPTWASIFIWILERRCQFIVKINVQNVFKWDGDIIANVYDLSFYLNCLVVLTYRRWNANFIILSSIMLRKLHNNKLIKFGQKPPHQFRFIS